MSLFISNRKEKEKFTLENQPKGWWIQEASSVDLFLGIKAQNGDTVRISKSTGEVFITHGPIRSSTPVTPVEIEIHTSE